MELIASLGVKINVLTNGHKDEDLFSSLAKKPIKTFDDLLRRVEKYITLEKIWKAKKGKTKPLGSEKKKAPKVKRFIQTGHLKEFIYHDRQSSQR
ncbi:hypothetical protein ACS0TY_023996 [Phlomoides rotata]